MSSQPSDVPTLTAYIKTLTVPQLKVLLKHEGLQVSGVKAALQFRIIHRSCPPLTTPGLFPKLPPFSILCEIKRWQPVLTLPQGLQSLAESDTVSYDVLATRIRSTAFPNSAPYPSHPAQQHQVPPVSRAPAQSGSAALRFSMPSHPYNPGSNVPVMTTPAPNPSGPLIFKESPFFNVVESLTPVVECKSMFL